jgi:hypothetical protein
MSEAACKLRAEGRHPDMLQSRKADLPIVGKRRQRGK